MAKTATWELKKGVSVLNASEGAMLLSSYGRRHWIRSEGIGNYGPQFIQWARQPFTAEDAGNRWKEFLNQEEIRDFIAVLMKGGFLNLLSVDAPEADIQLPLRPYFELVTNHKQVQISFAQKVRATRLALISNLEIPASWVDKATDWKEIMVVQDLPADPADMPILIAHVDDQTFIKKINQQALAAGRTVLPILIDSTGCFIGPIFGLQGQPCMQCVFLRRQSVQKEVSYEPEVETPDWNPRHWPHFFWDQLNAALQGEALKVVTQYIYPESMLGTHIMDFVNNRTLFEHVYRLPGCPACQEPKRVV